MGVKLGQKWAIKDGNLLASNQVGSRFFNKEFDFSRTTSGTYIDRDGVLQTAELYNLLPYSEDFSNAGWTKTNVTITENQIGYDGTNHAYLLENTAASGRIFEQLSASGNLTYSVYAKAGNTDWMALYCNGTAFQYVFFDLGNGVVGTDSSGNASSINIQDAGNGWYRCSITFNTTISDVRIFVANGDISLGLDGENIYIQGAQLVEGTQRAYQYTNGLQGLPRISYENGVGHLLLEPQRSNLLLQSNSFDTSWVASGYNITSGQSGIYGSNDAWLIEKISPTSNEYIRQSVSASSFGASIYAKANTSPSIMLYCDSGYCTWNLENGTFISGGGGYTGQSIESVGNGWYRLFVSGATTSNYFLQPKDATGQRTSGSVYIQHAQLESGSYPTSIIETTTTQVTRNADVCNNSGSAQDFNSEEGVIYFEFIRGNAVSGANSNFVGIFAPTHRISTFFSDSSNAMGLIINDSLGFLNTTLGQSFNAGETYKVALRYDSLETAFFVNGNKITTKRAPVFTEQLERIDFNPFSTYQSGNKYKNLQVFTEALSDEELENLTT